MAITLTETPLRSRTPAGFLQQSKVSSRNSYTSTSETNGTYAADEIFDRDRYDNLPILLPRGSTTEELYGDTGDFGSISTGQEEEDECRDKIDIEDVNFYSLEAHQCDGTLFDFAQLKGKYVLITNVASRCWHAWQVGHLEKIHERYGGDVVVIGFPSNDFGQERKSGSESEACLRTKYDCQFKIMDKVRVNGSQQHDVWRYLKEKKKGLFGMKFVKWNYEKFLVDREGKIVKRYSTFTFPKRIITDIDQLLEKDAKRREIKRKESKTLRKQALGVSETQKVIYI